MEGYSEILINENNLVEKLRQGDEEAFWWFVERFKNKAFAIAYRFTHNIEDARDLSQEAFVRLYSSFGKFKEQAKVSTWFYRILVNICIDFTRRRKFKVVSFSQFKKEEDNKNIEDRIEDRYSFSAVQEVLNKELNEKITQAIESLSPKQKTVFILRNYQGLSLKEIANIMRCAEGTVKAHLAKAVRNLQKIIEPYIRR